MLILKVLLVAIKISEITSGMRDFTIEVKVFNFVLNTEEDIQMIRGVIPCFL